MASFTEWFQALDELLYRNRPWWQIQPFHCIEYPWQNTALEAALDDLSDSDVASLDCNDADLVEWLKPWFEDAEALFENTQLPRFSARTLSVPERMDYQVPGRKWQQICAFTRARPASLKTPKSLLEWCSGKGHLGRLISAVDDCSVLSLEWQNALCEEGRALASRQKVDQEFACADVLAADSGQYFKRAPDAIALHACGDLHTRLLHHWSHCGGSTLTLSPCCYHLIKEECYKPLSNQAQAAKVQLSKDQLSLPLQKTVTAGASVRRRRDVELQWRMAFDLWQRQWRNIDEYLPVATVRAEQLRQSFSAFAIDLAQQKGLPVPSFIDEAYWLELGARRVQKIRRMELVTHLFRRPLEIWLVLDRVLFLEERGAKVKLGSFCAEQLTPRNIMIHATADHHH